MNRRHIALSVIFFFAVLLAITIKAGSEGCCFLNYADICYEDSEANCIEDEGEFFINGACSSVEKCNIGCCCETLPSHNPYPIRKGTCEEIFNGIFRELEQEECNELCGISDVCNTSCQPNAQDCAGRGIVVNAGDYYCWENNKSYPNQVLCTLPITDGGCQIIDQCDLGLEITEGCYCENSLYSSGFCCWDNSYTFGITGSDCPSANECERYPGMPPFFRCCGACKDDLQRWDNGNSYCATDYGSEKELCCQECAPDLVDCCGNEWQCQGSVLNYSYSSCPSGIPCDMSCIESVCALNQIINSGVNPYQMCECAGEYYDTKTDSRYCCPGGPEPSSCEVDTFNLAGYVYNADTGNEVPNANIMIENGMHTAQTGGNGEYIIENIDIGFGNFDVSVIKKGYYPKNFILSYPADPITLNQNFNIAPVGGICDEINPHSVAVFDINPIKGKKEVKLTWENPCEIPSKVVGYSIAREPGSYLGTFYTTNTSFIDDDVDWSSYSGISSDLKKYTYYIKAHYISGRSSSETSASITMGHYYCEGIFGDEEFCLSNTLTKLGDLTKRYSCDNYNDLTQQGIGGIPDCSPAVCVGPDKNGITDCKLKTNCREGGNLFGLFYAEEGCLSNDKYCYYDYSDTTVDDCKDCSTINNCYGYRSENACLTDNCLVTGAYSLERDSDNSPCSWHYTFEEFGKGICYDEDYNGIEYCGLCNKDSTAFYNLNCHQSICTELGSCYSDDTSCEPCLGNTKCEDFDNEDSCANAHSIAIRNINIGECPTEIIKSDDACGLGLCKWGVPTGYSNVMCFKDGNDDNMPDCDLREGIDHPCKEDFEPFTAIPQVDIPKIGAQGYGIHFYLTGGGTGNLRSFYFCIDKDNSCCPNIEKDVVVTAREIIINPLDETDIITGAGTYFIRYYSVDTHSNTEKVKSTEFFVDPLYPEIVFDHYFYSEAGHNYAVIVGASDEYVNCDYNLNSIPEEKVEDTNLNLGFNNTIFIKFKDLGEGNHMFTIICNDGVGNLVEVNYPLYVNFIQEMAVGYPDGKVLDTKTVRFHLTTTDDSDCIIEAIDASASGIPYNPLPSVAMDKAETTPDYLYNHTKTLTLEQDVSYVVKATCTPLIAGQEDSDFFHFTIDKQAPITSADFDFSAAHKSDPDTGLVTIRFNCGDPKINGVPGEAGCKGVYLCTGLNCHSNENNYNLLINEEYQTNVNNLYLSYFSVDNVGNKEGRTSHYNQRIKIDDTAPIVSISQIGPFTSNQYQTIRITIDDKSQIDNVQIKLEKVDPIYEVSVINATKVGVNQYKLHILLYEGLNLITATACDNALNCGQDTREIYLDVYPPEVGDIIIGDSDLDLDKDNIFEYKQSLSFAVKIEDNYLHSKDNLRYGIGVNTADVNIKIYDSNNNVAISANMVAGKDDYYYQNITQELSVGRYDATIEADDYFGNYNKKTASFEIRDTKQPSLILPELPSVVYKQSYDITGITDPDLQVRVTILDENWENSEYYDTVSGPEILPKEGFSDIPMADLFYNHYPKQGDTQLKFKGDWSDVLSVGNYLEFSNHYKMPRYKILDIDVVGYGFGSRFTKIIIDFPLENNVLGSHTVSLFTSPYPSGSFNIPIKFKDGINNLVVSVIKPGIKPIDVLKLVIYDTIRTPSIQLDYPPIWTGTIFTTKSPTFKGSIISTTIDVPVTRSELIINEITYDLTLDNEGKFSQTVNLPADGDYSFTILANNSEGYSKTEKGSITIDTAGPGGCIRVEDIIYCTDGNSATIPSSCKELSLIIEASYGAACMDQKYDKRADIDNDGDIDVSDLASWGLNSNNAEWCSEQLTDMFDPCAA